MKSEFTGFAKVLKKEFRGDIDSDYIRFKKWEKNNIVRIYLNDYKKRTIGYLESGVFCLIDRCGLSHDEINTAINNFNNEYEINVKEENENE